MHQFRPAQALEVTCGLFHCLWCQIHWYFATVRLIYSFNIKRFFRCINLDLLKPLGMYFWTILWFMVANFMTFRCWKPCYQFQHQKVLWMHQFEPAGKVLGLFHDLWCKVLWHFVAASLVNSYNIKRSFRGINFNLLKPGKVLVGYFMIYGAKFFDISWLQVLSSVTTSKVF